MNTDIKWEAVDPKILKKGDDIRIRTKGGTVWIPALYRYPNTSMSHEVWLDGAESSNSLIAEHWNFERAVPERTLPTEDGWYQAQSATEMSVFELYGGVWFHVTLSRVQVDDLADLPDDLVRLVPATEAEEAEARGIRKAHDTLALIGLDHAAGKLRDAFPAMQWEA